MSAPARISRMIDATDSSGRSAMALAGLTRALVWLTVVVASSAVVSFAAALIQ